MRVTIIGPAYPLRGGISVTDEAMCRAFRKAGHEANIVTFKMQYPVLLFPGKTQLSEGPQPEGLDIHVWMNSVNPLNWIRVAKRINKLNPDLVIFRQWIPFMGPCFGTIARFLKKSIRVFTVVDNLYPHEKRPFDKILTNYFLKTCDGFITFSTTVKQQIESLNYTDIVYTPHPLDDNLGQKVNKEEACKYLGLDSNLKYVLFFGLVRKYKGLDLLLQSFANVDIRDLGIKLLVVGEFYDDPENYNKIIQENNLSDLVQITNQFVPTSDIKYYFSASDLVAQTYHSATQSGITQIAYNFDRPMLVTNVGGLSEYVPHLKVGYVVEKDPGQIAESIVDFFRNERFEEFTVNAKEEKKKYGWEVFVEQVIELFHSVPPN